MEIFSSYTLCLSVCKWGRWRSPVHAEICLPSLTFCRKDVLHRQKGNGRHVACRHWTISRKIMKSTSEDTVSPHQETKGEVNIDFPGASHVSSTCFLRHSVGSDAEEHFDFGRALLLFHRASSKPSKASTTLLKLIYKRWEGFWRTVKNCGHYPNRRAEGQNFAAEHPASIAIHYFCLRCVCWRLLMCRNCQAGVLEATNSDQVTHSEMVEMHFIMSKL